MTTHTARNAVMLSFLLNGFAFATWASRIPDVRDRLDLDNGQLGLLLLVIACGSVLTLPTTGALIARFGAAAVVRAGVTSALIGLLGASVGVAMAAVPVVACSLFFYGLGVGIWDVAMNVEGAAVERRLGRTIMPRFHAGFSLGTVFGAMLGAAAAGLDIPMSWHVGVLAALVFVIVQVTTGGFLPRVAEGDSEAGPRQAAWRAWLEPRTLLIGVMVFALAVTEGTANDWLAVALIDGYDVPHWMGIAGFGLFLTAMTLARVAGTVVLDRYDRVPVLWTTMAAAALGVLIIVYGGPLAPLGIVLWGLGASLGFPVGMSAASDDEANAPARVSVVSTIAYTAFLAGPPLLGFVADHVGTLHALLAVAILLVPSALVVPAARKQESQPA